MSFNPHFNHQEQAEATAAYNKLRSLLKEQISPADVRLLTSIMERAAEQGRYSRDKYGFHPLLRSMRTALLFNTLVAPDRTITLAILLYRLCRDEEVVTRQELARHFGDDMLVLVEGMLKVSQLYKKQASVENDNFHKLLLTFARDIRVIIIMIVDRLALMRVINHHPDEKFVRDISLESRYLYAPLAHRLGLYLIKSELEDLSLKYLNRKVYNQIVHKLKEAKEVRDQYVDDFIKPIRQALVNSGLTFEIKGRTKSINSIWNKMKKQGVDLNGMYDLFAIRIILDTPLDQEKKECWIAYSIVTDIYAANVARLKDWISMPKSNGYESLHITVMGPGDKWVEVQIRTKRMDEIAERGLAAHWKYKGIKSEGDVDQWMNNVREVLEAGAKGPMDLIRDMRMNIYEDEVYVFTPKGDVFNLPQGATLLDFAFHIHSNVGAHCTGGRVDGKNQKLGYKLKSGDTVEVLTASTQMPRLDWLNHVVTSKARNKIRQAVNEARVKKADMARELVQRRFKNRKIDLEEAMMAKFIVKQGYKSATDFYVDIDDGKIDVGTLVEDYVDFCHKVQEAAGAKAKAMHETAQNFVLQPRADDEQPAASSDILVIGNNVKGINYKLSKCCNPIYGDAIVGFIASDGAIKIHRRDCGNVRHLLEKYPYRIIKSRWSGKMGSQFAATLKVVGRDDIGIVSNITSVINKEGDTVLRSISISSNGGLFEGYLVIGVTSLDTLDILIKKIKNLKGVKDVQRT